MKYSWKNVFEFSLAFGIYVWGKVDTVSGCADTVFIVVNASNVRNRNIMIFM